MMPGRASQPRKDAPDQTETFVEAEKETQERIDALKRDVSEAKEEATDGHFHTSADVHSGVCHGGPMEGMEGESRYPKGFVLLDERDSRAWVYDRHGDSFIAREVQPLNRVGAERAAIEDTYDVRAYDRETMRSH